MSYTFTSPLDVFAFATIVRFLDIPYRIESLPALWFGYIIGQKLGIARIADVGGNDLERYIWCAARHVGVAMDVRAFQSEKGAGFARVMTGESVCNRTQRPLVDIPVYTLKKMWTKFAINSDNSQF